MNKAIKLSLALVIAVMLFAMLAIFASAEVYTAKYCDIGGGQKATVKTDENGKIVLKDTYSNTNESKVFYGWFTQDGKFYAPGTELTLTEDTMFREASAYVVTTEADLKTYLNGNKNPGGLVRLDEDLTITTKTGAPSGSGGGTQVYLDLNGHTITYTGTDPLFNAQRTGLNLLNSSQTEAKIIANNISSANSLFHVSRHGFGDGKKIAFSVGTNVEVQTTGALVKSTSHLYDPNDSDGWECPYVRIWGEVTARALVDQNGKTSYIADVRILNGADVTLTGTTWWENMYVDYTATLAKLTIEDGARLTITSPVGFDWHEDRLGFDYAITGGSFNVSLPKTLLNEGYEPVFDEDERRYNVEYVACTIEGSNGVHTFVKQEAYMGNEPTCTEGGMYVFRCACGSQQINAVEALGHAYTNITIVTPATTTQSGEKKYSCERCDASYTEAYTLDAAESEITLVVKTDDGTKEITVLLKDAYSITTSGNAVTFNGVASQIVVGEETYTKADIVKLVIPVGITNIAASAINGYTALEEIEIGEGANITFAQASIKACPNLKLLTAKGCTVIFQQYTVDSCASFATIDVTDANATFEKYSFCKNTAIKHVLMASGHTYTFGEDAFRYSGLEEVILPDDSTVTVGKKSFAETTTIKYVYVGKNCIASKSFADQGSLFGGNSYLSKVVLMDIEYIGQWVFSTKAPGAAYGPLCDLTVYIHSDTIGFATSGSFNTRNGDYKVYVYMKATEYTGAPIAGDNNSATNNPNVVLYKGIPHAYTAQASSATCTTAGSTAYTIDCPCGVIESGRYTVEAYSAYTGDTAGATIDVGVVTEAKGHEFDVADGATIVTIIPATCATNEIVVYKCANCDETTSVETPNTLTSHIPSGEWQVLIQVACTTDGVRQQLCTVCRDTAIVEIIPATNHTASEEWTLVRDANCTLEKIEAKKCISCGEIVETKVTEANGHTAGSWTQVASANCIETGWQTQSCTVCNTVIDEKAIDALGHEFDIADGASVISISYGDGFDKAGTVNTKCARCDEEQQGAVEAIFEALGYSVGPDGYSLKAGFMVNAEALGAYKALYPSFTFGIVMANANTVVSTQGFFTNGSLNASAKGFMISIESLKYVSWNADVAGFTANNAGSLELVVGIYTNDGEGNVSVIQYVDADKYATTKTYTDMSLNAITFNQVRVGHGMEALVPQSTPASTGDEE